MQYREIKESELIDLKKLQSIVYFMKFNKDEPAKEPEYDKLRWKYARGAFTDEGKLAAILEISPFKAYLDGVIVGMPGIAGVATLLEHRRSGAVKNLLKNAYKEMYEKGDVMSYLYPFSHGYYRKYGYAQGSYADKLKVEINQFKKVEAKGYTKQFFPGDSLDDIKIVYDYFASQYNCCVAREDWRWNRLFSKDPYKTGDRVFVRYNTSDQPIAYIRFKEKVIGEYKYDMEVIETAWAGTEGISGLLSILNGFNGDLQKISMCTPPGFPIELLVKEIWELEVTRWHTGMSRIINAQKALEIIKKPENTGKAIVELYDEHAPWNTGNWLIEWDHLGSRAIKTDKEADLKCTASSFAQLVTGYMSLDNMCLNPDVEIMGNKDILQKLFIKKECFIWDRF
ncbi:MAG: GNAT family N-acetyltransferase [Clostridiales bacterium]|nr:GNAT family N-acetyltransferase [Clostridiales bacterium]